MCLGCEKANDVQFFENLVAADVRANGDETNEYGRLTDGARPQLTGRAGQLSQVERGRFVPAM